MPSADSRPAPGQAATSSNGSETGDGLKLGTYRPIWAAPEVEVSPALHYTIARQRLEVSPEDAHRLGIRPGDAVTISQNGTRLRGTAHVRSGVPEGTAFLAEGLAEDSANVLTGAVVEVHKR
jgi:NADH-quinone oxidoreductase subunit G